VKIHHLLETPATDRPLVVAIGFFDGLHRGHREIVKTLLRLRRPGYRAAVVTFRNHPATYLRPDRVPPLITTLEERVNLLASTGIDELFLTPFDEHIAHMDARVFLTDALVATLGIRALAIGENFRFGHGREGDAALARTVLGERGVDVAAVPPLTDQDERISSTRVRAAILSGDTATADRLLGAPYTLRGTVALGAGRGHDLGFPTANLVPAADKTLPADGVYACIGRYEGRDYRGLVSIGTNPTFDGAARTVEAWLLDFRTSLYGEELSLREFRFIREQRRFDDVAALLAQMNDDASHARFPSFSAS